MQRYAYHVRERPNHADLSLDTKFWGSYTKSRNARKPHARKRRQHFAIHECHEQSAISLPETSHGRHFHVVLFHLSVTSRKRKGTGTAARRHFRRNCHYQRPHRRNHWAWRLEGCTATLALYLSKLQCLGYYKARLNVRIDQRSTIIADLICTPAFGA